MAVSPASTVLIQVSEEAFDGDQPLVAVMRGNHVGSLHRGTFAVVSSDGEERLLLGDAEQRVYLRSAAKPFQVMPAVLSGALAKFGISQPELAVLCASHSAEPRHTDAVLSVLAKLGLSESALACGIHPPMHERTARRRWREGIEPSPVCNNCSGAHTGMLAACRANAWPVEGYGSIDHPLQQQTRKILAEFAGLEPGEVGFATDNCHVPTFYLSLRNAAMAFARLATPGGVPSELVHAAQTVVHAMTSHPGMVGGEQRFDSDLMEAAQGTIVAKGGAEGFQGVGVIGRDLGLAMKVSDGNSRAIPPAVMRILDSLGPLSPEQSALLESYREPLSRDLQAEIVGRSIPAFAIAGI